MWIHPCRGPRRTLNVFLYSKPRNSLRQGFSLNTKIIAQTPGWPVAPGPTLQCWGYRTGTLGFSELLQLVVLFAKPAPSPSISILTRGAEMRLVLRTCVLVTIPLLPTAQHTNHSTRSQGSASPCIFLWAPCSSEGENLSQILPELPVEWPICSFFASVTSLIEAKGLRVLTLSI